jgi:hypothetical protein
MKPKLFEIQMTKDYIIALILLINTAYISILSLFQSYNQVNKTNCQAQVTSVSKERPSWAQILLSNLKI